MTYRISALIAIISTLAGGCATSSSTSSNDSPEHSSVARTISPGAPGESSRVMSEDEINDTSALAFTDADVHFMSGMIAHHAQALEMTALVDGRSDRDDIRMLASRIDVSQTSEIKLMQKWLRDRDQDVPDASSMHMEHGLPMLMPGMLTESDMALLTSSTGDTFYEHFLSFMIAHHQGAITMVNNLLATPGAAQDTYVFMFASDVDVDQRMEITRMQHMIDGLR